MAYSKIKKILFILLCLFILLFPFWCVRGLCAETEEVTTTALTNCGANSNSNAFLSSGTINYFEVEKGYIYTITVTSSMQGGRIIVGSSEVPSPGVNYTILYENLRNEGDYYTYYANTNDIVFVSYGPGVTSSNVVVTREPMQSMDSAVSGLVENVGLQSLWNTFNSANNFIVVVVLFSFGLFIIIALVRKLRKGKGGI